MRKILAFACFVLLLTASVGCSRKDTPQARANIAQPTLQIAVARQAAVTSVGAAADTTLFSEQTGGNYGGHVSMCVGRNQGTCTVDSLPVTGNRHSVVAFTLPGVPAGKDVFSATLRLYAIRGNGLPFNITASRLTQAFTEGAGNDNALEGSQGGPCGTHGTLASSVSASTANWTHRSGIVLWSTAGGAAIATDAATISIALGVNSWDVTQIVRTWYGGTANDGFLLTPPASVEAGASKIDVVLATRETVAAPPVVPPALAIDFRNAGGQACALTSDCAYGLTCVGNICCQQSSCNDGSVCTTDTCGGAGGTCLFTSAVTCSALDQCHDVGTCNAITGVCSNPVHVGSCNDGNACTYSDTCNGAGACVGTTIACTSDPNSCATLSCNGTSTCASAPRTSGTCNDGNACTYTDTCNGAGTCVGTAITCTSDPNACTTLACNGTSTCTSTPRTSGACNDGNLCTYTDTCNGSAVCVGTAIACTSDPTACATLSCNGTSTCTSTPRTSGTCNDGNLCTYTDTCNGAGSCVGTGIACTSDPNACTTLSCNGTSTCASAPRTSGTCNDSNACTYTDTCNGAGSCVGTAITCTSDPTACTTLSCNGTSTCASAPRTSGTCNDGNLCTYTDTCNGAGSCVGTAIACTSDPTACATLSCNGTSTCASAPRTSGTCNDGNLCTYTDTCNGGGSCVGTGITCTSDPNACTTLSCNGTSTCASAPRTSGTCNDSNACTFTDTCNGAGTCAGIGITCTSDPNACATLACNGTSSCTSTPRTSGTCNDGNACTFTDTCNGAGTCAGTGITCTSDPTACTTLSCNGTGTCASAPRTSGTCNDGNACTFTDTCNGGGSCVGTGITCTSDPNACITLSCNGTSTCASAPRTSGSCNDSNACTHTDTCNGAGSCLGTGITCTSDACNTRACNGTSTCAVTPLTGPVCNDGDACSQTDTCSSGSCVGSNPVVCTPLDQCHNAGVCASGSGLCSNPVKPGTPACDDSLACTVGEKCNASGVCTGGTAADCSASGADACHAGQCAEPGGCFSQPLTGNPCDDGNACTVGTTCSAGSVCNGGSALPCDDGDPCTTDSCNTADGCHHVSAPDGTACALDANPCTRDTCLAGTCHTPSTAGTACGAAASCTGTVPSAVATPAGTCDGTTTTCNQVPIPCGSQPCSGATCLGACTLDAQCSGTQYCDLSNGQCKTKLGAGGGCLRTAMCNALTCVDSVCCTSACAGGATDCMTCNGTSPGTCTPLALNAPCNDGLFCNGTDKCNASGTCNVNAGNPCPGADGDGNCAESCNEATDSCTAPDPNGSVCNDSVFCNVGEACQGGLCVGGSARDCSLFTDQCNVGICNEAGSTCQASPVTGTSCNADNSLCTNADQCLSGVCQAGSPLSCNDGNSCTADSCVAATGCSNVVLGNGSACTNDGNPCTLDTCLGGVCNTAVANGTGCGVAASCSGLIPNAAEIPAASCQGGTCTSQTPVACGPAVPCNGTACQGSCATDAQCAAGFFCNVPLSQCQPDKAPGGPCTRDTMCQTGTTCVDTVCCTTACGGGVATDCVTCNGAGTAGTCTNQTGTSCDDTLFCNGADTCNAGVCNVHAAVPPCPGADGDGNCKESCNEATDTCNANDPVGSVCDDGLFCTVSEKCNAAGVCTGGTPKDCSASGDQCNTASCDETNHVCKGTPLNGNACNDGSSCTTNDKCNTGTCIGTTNCDDGNPCTDDSCGAGVCVHTANTAPCDDGSKCTTNDQCANKACVGGPALVCNDGNACTDDGCNPATGCTKTNNNANPCSDNDGCTTGDHCVAGACIPTGGKSCDDANPCTDDSCTGAGVCVNTANTAACNDNNACTSGDKCANKACVPGPATVCDDGKACTDDTCDPVLGCKSTNDDTNPCSDNNACTAPDHCSSGTCVGTTISCNDSNVCTDDSCDTTLGCQHANNALACDDSDACTTADKCAGGNCVGGPALPCDDGKICTVDSCAAATGCVFTPGNSGTQCRAANGICDDAETCNGTSPNCPADVFNASRTCSPASCTLGQGTPAGVCSGVSGACPAVTAASCGNYVCNGTACRTTCTAPTDCAQGSYCDATGHCTTKGQPGDPCTSGGQCNSTFCADGLCCNSDCSGKCEACNLPASRGACKPVTGTPTGSRPACIGDGTGCDGTCDGINTNACAMPGQSKQCRAASCNASTNTATDPAFCDGSGSCPPLATTPCGAQVCGATACSGCATDAQCGAGQFCSGSGLCQPIAGPGTTCSRDLECKSGHCIDGVCCDADCTGQCESCKAAGKIGTCVAVTGAPAAGRSPCNGALGTECAGKCDGNTRRSCIYPGFGTVCQGAKCESNRATVTAFCNGAGKCPPAEQQDCKTGCDGDICAGGCTGTGTCDDVTRYCSGGVCVPLKGAGASCSTSVECASSYCVDDVCCTAPCSGQCEACNEPGSEGTCVPVTKAPRGSRQACVSNDANCVGQCDGVNATRCAYPDSTKTCGAGAVCTGGIATLGSTCQSDGSCGPVQKQDCGANGCETAGVICANGCTTDGDCAASEYCSAGVCVAKLPPGATCGGPSQCALGHCVDGLCCDTACTGQCEACDQQSSLGTCAVVTGAPRGGRAACAGSGACGGFCAGVNRAACTIPTASTSCGIAFCEEGTSASAPTCANSICVPAAPESCNPFVCDPATQGCLTNCVSNADCASGLVCDGNSCVPPSAPDAGGPDAAAPDASVGTGGTAPGPDAGAGGAPGAGGAAGAGGTGGSGGNAGSGGSAGGNGRDAGADASKDAGLINGRDTGSCGCRVPGAGSSRTSSPLSLLAAASVLLLRRGYRRRARGRGVRKATRPS